MKRIQYLIILSLLMLSQFAFSQNTSNKSVLFENNTVTIAAKRTDCIDHQNGTAKTYQLLEIANKSASTVIVSFKKELWYSGKCISCDSNSNEFNIQLELNPNETKTGSCDVGEQLRVFVKMLDLKGVRQLTHFELKDIEVTEL